MNQKIQSPEMLKSIGAVYLAQQAGFTRRVLVCGGAGCVSCHCQEVKDALDASLSALDLTDQVQVLVTGCIGLCAAGPILVVEPEGVLYTNMTPERVAGGCPNASFGRQHSGGIHLSGPTTQCPYSPPQGHRLFPKAGADCAAQLRSDGFRLFGGLYCERRLPGAGERIVATARRNR